MIGITVYKKKESVKYQDLIVVNKQLENFDPTRTTSLRNSFMADMDRRFNILLREITKAIVEDDVFGLKKTDHQIKIKTITVHATPGKEAFKFTTSTDKVTKFMEWVREQEKKGLLQTTTIQQTGTAIESAWTDLYVQDSYKRGVIRSRYELGKAGMGTPGIEKTGGISATMSTPFHMDRVGILYARVFTDLKGITSQMDSAISRVLSQGIIDGDNPRTLAKKITDSTGIFKQRARTIARTEVIRAHHMGAVQEYRNWGLQGVKVQAEWSTAGFNVCDKCKELEGKIFTLDEIEGMIPHHPNCRCMALPVLNEKGIKKVEDKNEWTDWEKLDQTTLKKLVGKNLTPLKQKYYSEIEEIYEEGFSFTPASAMAVRNPETGIVEATLRINLKAIKANYSPPALRKTQFDLLDDRINNLKKELQYAKDYGYDDDVIRYQNRLEKYMEERTTLCEYFNSAELANSMEESVEMVIDHEYCHIIQANSRFSLKDGQKIKQDIYDYHYKLLNENPKTFAKYYTEYSKVEPDEFWAEAFALYRKGKLKDKVMVNLLNKMDELW